MLYLPAKYDLSMKNSRTPSLVAAAISLAGAIGFTYDYYTRSYYQSRVNPETFRLWEDAYRKDVMEKVDSLILKHKK